MSSGQTAWLVTWIWIGNHAAVEDEIAAILRPRLTQRAVGDIVECLYALREYSPSEIARWTRRPKENPYRAKWSDGRVCECGHNPFLQAMYVRNLEFVRDPTTGIETISWTTPPLYELNRETLERKLIRGPMPMSVTRSITGPLSTRSLAGELGA